MKIKGVLSILLTLALLASLFTGLASAAGADFIEPANESWRESAADNAFIQALRADYDVPQIEYRTEARWWIAGGNHTDETLIRSIEELYEAGFGAVEIAVLENPSVDDGIYGWGSQEFISDMHLVIRETAARGMGVALTGGAYWASANLPDTFTWGGQRFGPDNIAALKELSCEIVPLQAGERFNGIIPVPAVSEGVADYELVALLGVQVVSEGVLDPTTIVDLEDNVSSSGSALALDWTAPSAAGKYQIMAFWMHGTGQTAVPSYSTNYGVNYVDSYGFQAVIDYWEANLFTPEIKAILRESGRGEFFMDSMQMLMNNELFWGYSMLDEFESRRGYDLKPYLPFIMSSGASMINPPGMPRFLAVEGKDPKTANVRNDFFQTMTELYEENVLKALQEWLHSFNMALRIQPSYGMTYEISTPGRYIDTIEGESWQLGAQIDSFRNLAGSAHLYGRLLSSETGAWVNQNYKLGIDHYTQLIHTQFAAGVKRTVFHGYSSIAGPEGTTRWPGNEGMGDSLTLRLGSRDPAFRHYDEWTTMLARNQKALRQRNPRMDLAILRTDYGFNNGMLSMFLPRPALYDMYLRDPDNKRGLYWMDLALQNAGYTYDFFAPANLEDERVSCAGGLVQPDGPGYQALIIYQEEIPYASAEKILEIARDYGVPVVFVNNVSEVQSSMLFMSETIVRHGPAASRSMFNDRSNAELKAIVDQIKALPNVMEINNQGSALTALGSLGVHPRVAFSSPNDKILTVARQTDDRFYVYAYSYMFEDTEPFTFEMNIDAAGKPYYINAWTGDIGEVGVYQMQNGKTNVTLTLNPGEAVIIVLDLNDDGSGLHVVSTDARKIAMSGSRTAIVSTQSGEYQATMSDGRMVTANITAPDAIALTDWNLVVEDWKPGGKVTVSESKLGRTTAEVYFETGKTPINAGKIDALAPWKDIPSVGPDVSGIGYYTAAFTLPADWTKNNGAYLELGSTNGNSAAVYVNNQKASGIDTVTLTADISEFLVPGVNTIAVEVSSTLANRIREVYDGTFAGIGLDMQPQSYGMTGEVFVVPYTMAIISGINITAASTAGGTASGGGLFTAGDAVALTAAANSGYTFSGWYEGNSIVSTDALYTFTASADRTLEARFAARGGGLSRPPAGTAVTPPVPSPGGSDPETPPPSGSDYTPFAQELFKLGLFLGYGDDDAGNPVFGLGDELSRIQALVLTLRMLGLEDAVQAHAGSHPFTDVSGWQTPYVAYAFENGLTTGVSADRFAPHSQVTLQQFTTFMLRALKYSDTDGEDFEYADAIEFALTLGLLTDDLLAEFGSGSFLRGEAVRVMINALLTEVNEEDGGILLYELAGAEVFSQAAAEAFLAVFDRNA